MVYNHAYDHEQNQASNIVYNETYSNVCNAGFNKVYKAALNE